MGGDTDGKQRIKGKGAAPGETYDAAFRGYVNLTLSEQQKDAYEAWSNSASFWDALEVHVADGVNVSVKIDPKSGGFIASATQRRVGSPNAGLVVTARGKEAVVAFGRVVFCLTVLSKNQRWEDTQPVADPDRW